MQIFELLAFLTSLAAVFSYLNVRWLKLPSGISMLLLGTLVSIVVLLIGFASKSLTTAAQQALSIINFPFFILQILLSFLLFAGSLHVNGEDVKKSRKSIGLFAVFGTVISTLLVGSLVFIFLSTIGLTVPFITCLVFGAVVSPTDPIAVLGIIRQAGLPKSIEVKIVGESLFNDGIGVVIFAVLLDISQSGMENFSPLSILGIFIREALGGIGAGLVIGYLGFRVMKSIDHFQTEILVSLAMVMGGYVLCQYMHVSGPLAMVVAGIITGSKSKVEAMSDTTRDYLEKFWDVTDEILNAALFMLVGLELLLVNFQITYFVLGLIASVTLFIARYLSLWFTKTLFRLQDQMEERTLALMTWGGLRGGISVALALSLPADANKEMFVALTFVVVITSVIAQGLSIGPLIRKWKVGL